MMKRAIFSLVAAALALSARAQDGGGKQDPPKDGKQDPKDPKKQDRPDHEMHIRPFAEIWKDIETKQKEIKSFKAQIAVAVSDQVSDSTTWLKGDLFVKREDKDGKAQPPLLFWRVGQEKPNSDSTAKPQITITQRSFHDGAQVTVTDESDPKDLRYWKDTVAAEPHFMPQDIILYGGKEIVRYFEVKTLMDPKLAKTERTISKGLDDRLEKKDDKNDGSYDPSKAENRVDSYAFELTPKDGEVKKQLSRMMLKLDALSMMPMQITAEFHDGSRVMITITNVTKLDAAEMEKEKYFDFSWLNDSFKKAE